MSVIDMNVWILSFDAVTFYEATRKTDAVIHHRTQINKVSLVNLSNIYRFYGLFSGLALRLYQTASESPISNEYEFFDSGGQLDMRNRYLSS